MIEAVGEALEFVRFFGLFAAGCVAFMVLATCAAAVGDWRDQRRLARRRNGVAS